MLHLVNIGTVKATLCSGAPMIFYEYLPRLLSDFSEVRIRKLNTMLFGMYEGHLESKERFAIQRYLLIIGKKKNMQVL